MRAAVKTAAVGRPSGPPVASPLIGAMWDTFHLSFVNSDYTQKQR